MKKSIVLLAHNIRSLWNVGSFFRTADAFSVEKIFLTGYTGIPPRREIAKTALGADEWVPWEYQEDAKSVIDELRTSGYRIVALEQTDKAVDIASYTSPERMCLVLGHEVTGVSDELLALCDEHIHIPMNGKKESLNVSVAAGIALHHIR